MLYVEKQTKPVRGKVQVAGDRDISRLALILSALTTGKVSIKGLSKANNVMGLIKILRSLGVSIQENKKEDVFVVEGCGIDGLKEPKNVINVGNSLANLHYLVGLLSPCDFKLFFTGNQEIENNSLGDLFQVFGRSGVGFDARENDRAPFLMKGNPKIQPFDLKMTKPNSDFKAALLLSALNTNGVSSVLESQKSNDHIEVLLKHFGAEFEEKEIQNKRFFSKDVVYGKEINLAGKQKLRAKNVNVSGDLNLSAFLTVAALLIQKSEIVLQNVNVNSLKDAFYRTLTDMDLDVEFINQKISCGEKTTDIKVKYSKPAEIVLSAKRVESMINEYPALILLAASRDYNIKIQGLNKIKEKDGENYEVLKRCFKKFGLKFLENKNTLEFENKVSVKKEIVIKEQISDCKVLLAVLLFGLISNKRILIKNGYLIENAYPNIQSSLKKIGIKLSNLEKK